MIASKTIVSALTLSALAAAAPAPSNFSIRQVAVKGHDVHPAALYARALARFDLEVPEHIARAASTCEKGSVITNPYKNDATYLTPVKVGNNNLLMNFDTGSASLWVMTKSTPDIGSHKTYDPRTGRLMKDYFWSAKNGKGVTLQGGVYRDKVTIAGITYGDQAVQTVKIVIPASAGLSKRPYDGIVGFALSQRNTVRPNLQQTFFENIKDKLVDPVLGIYLKHGAPGAFDFGWVDDKKFKGDLVWMGVDSSQGLWKIIVDGYAIGNEFSSPYSFNAIIDTGTSILLLEEKIVKEYYKMISSAYYDSANGGWVFRCDDIIPNLIFNIGPYSAEIPGDYMKYLSNGTYCYGGAQSLPGGRRDTSVLGDIFIKTQYLVLDHSDPKNPRVGIASQAY